MFRVTVERTELECKVAPSQEAIRQAFFASHEYLLLDDIKSPKRRPYAEGYWKDFEGC